LPVGLLILFKKILSQLSKKKPLSISDDFCAESLVSSKKKSQLFCSQLIGASKQVFEIT
jgi:hypothetical protein